MRNNDLDGFELAGHIGVDAGLCWIGDPCYVIHADPLPDTLGKDWLGFVDTLQEGHTSLDVKSFNYQLGHEGLGVCVSTGYGDGTYPVYVRKEDGRIAEVRVLFMQDEAEEDEDDYGYEDEEEDNEDGE